MILNSKFCLIASPRCASTSLQEAFKLAGYPRDGRENHSSVHRIKNMSDYKGQPIVAFCRNPYDLFVSHFSWLTKQEFKRQMMKTVTAEKYGQSNYLAIDGKLAVDHLGHYETLQDDFNRICKILEINATLGHENASPNRRPYEDYYDDQLLEYVYNTFRLDFVIGGYEIAKEADSINTKVTVDF